MSVTTRIAPSPTGYLHFGLARTALFCYLYARQQGGTYILRIEDTDLKRNQPEFEADIMEQFEWLDLNPDQKFRQSEHAARHTECLKSLIDADKAYISEEPSKDDASKTVAVVRLRNKGETITFNDVIRGEITFDTTELGDFVIARSINEPLYHMAVVVDDHDEGVTHVIRGEDHVSNTQRHILLQRALGFETPVYAHLPLILMPDKSKMSKRKHESSVKHFREQGILPAALINYVALLGWNPGTEQEIFTLHELTRAFKLEQIHKSGAVFDQEKLLWFNREYLKMLSDEEFRGYALPVLQESLSARGIEWNGALAELLLPMIRERIARSQDIRDMAADGEFDFFFRAPELDTTKIPQKGSDAATAVKHLAWIHEALTNASSEIFQSSERLKDIVWNYATNEGRGAVLWPLRFALSGRERSPEPFFIISIIGKEEALRRIEAARARLV